MNKHLISFSAFVLCAALSAFQLWLWQDAVHEHLATAGELDLQLGRAGLACGLFFLCLLGIVQATRLWWRLLKAPAPDSYEAQRAAQAAREADAAAKAQVMAMAAAEAEAQAAAEVNEDADADTAMAEVSHAEIAVAAAPLMVTSVPATKGKPTVTAAAATATTKPKVTLRKPVLENAPSQTARPQRPALTRYEKLEKRWWR